MANAPGPACATLGAVAPAPVPVPSLDALAAGTTPGTADLSDG
jgi:hypothetical protein